MANFKRGTLDPMSQRFEVIEEDCIGCGLCSERAPENLEIRDSDRLAQVFKQPETPLEEDACLEASDYCPVGGLHAKAVDSAPTDSSAPDATHSTPIAAGVPLPVADTPTRSES